MSMDADQPASWTWGSDRTPPPDADAGTGGGMPWDGGMSWEEQRQALEAARVVLTGLAGAVWQESSRELASLMGLLDEVTARAGAAKVAVAVEAASRGVVGESQCAGVRGWVREHAPSGVGGSAGQVARLVAAFTHPTSGASVETGLVRSAVCDAVVTAGVGVAVLDQYGKLSSRLQPGVGPTVVKQMIEAGRVWGPAGVARLRRGIIAHFGGDGELDDLAAADAAQVELAGGGSVDGIAVYRLTLDAASKAVLEAAIGPLSRPQPVIDEASGRVVEADRRSAGQRRGQALVEVCRRAIAAATGSGSGSGSGLKSMVYVTMGLEELRARVGAGSPVGSLAAGEVLAPERVRQIACEAGIIPVVLGSGTAIVDVGRVRRSFPSGMTRRLWLRDGRCSFPGCDIPAHWCDAHHLQHWVDGGATSIENAALLCGRHHTVVHTQRLHGQVSADGVVWNRVPGSYDRWLADHPPGRKIA